MVRSNLTPLVIAGPTASGKSNLAISLALRHFGEIICADSRQFYSGMSIGTCCPSEQDLATVPHHGYGMLDPKTEKMDAGFFIRFARQKIEEIQQRGKRPILVGGTGLYFRDLHHGLSVPKKDKDISTSLMQRLEQYGSCALHAELEKIDPQSAAKISTKDSYRIMRALEIYLVSGMSATVLRDSFSTSKAQLRARWLYLKPDRSELLKKIEARVSLMFDAGLIDEAINLRRHLPREHWALTVMGYQEALQYVDQKLPLNLAMEKIFIRHRQYAKRQYTWFNKESFFRIISD
jgi:tRNA dimethylallyltransferase